MAIALALCSGRRTILRGGQRVNIPTVRLERLPLNDESPSLPNGDTQRGGSKSSLNRVTLVHVV